MESLHSVLSSSQWLPGYVRDQTVHLREWILACANNKFHVMEKLARSKLHFLASLLRIATLRTYLRSIVACTRETEIP